MRPASLLWIATFLPNVIGAQQCSEPMIVDAQNAKWSFSYDSFIDFILTLARVPPVNIKSGVGLQAQYGVNSLLKDVPDPVRLLATQQALAFACTQLSRDPQLTGAQRAERYAQFALVLSGAQPNGIPSSAISERTVSKSFQPAPSAKPSPRKAVSSSPETLPSPPPLISGGSVEDVTVLQADLPPGMQVVKATNGAARRIFLGAISESGSKSPDDIQVKKTSDLSPLELRRQARLLAVDLDAFGENITDKRNAALRTQTFPAEEKKARNELEALESTYRAIKTISEEKYRSQFSDRATSLRDDLWSRLALTDRAQKLNLDYAYASSPESVANVAKDLRRLATALTSKADGK